MKPKPLASLNHLTVPVSRCDITCSLEHGLKVPLARRCAGCKEKASRNDGADQGSTASGHKARGPLANTASAPYPGRRGNAITCVLPVQDAGAVPPRPDCPRPAAG